MNTALISGFEPFDGSSLNPSWLAVSALPDHIGSFAIKKILLPVSFANAFPRLEEAIAACQPVLVIPEMSDNQALNSGMPLPEITRALQIATETCSDHLAGQTAPGRQSCQFKHIPRRQRPCRRPHLPCSRKVGHQHQLATAGIISRDCANRVATLYQRKQAIFSENKVYPFARLKDLRADLTEKGRQMCS